MISLATKYPNVFIDTSAWNARRYPRELVDYRRAHACRKVLFASNYPAWPARNCLERFESLELDPEVEAFFFHENAEHVFRPTGA